MPFIIQFVLSVIVSIALFLFFWVQLMNKTKDRNSLGSLVGCEYCHLAAVTTCVESYSNATVAVCMEHIDMFLDED